MEEVEGGEEGEEEVTVPHHGTTLRTHEENTKLTTRARELKKNIIYQNHHRAASTAPSGRHQK